MLSTPDYRKGIRFEHKSAIMLTDEHSKYSFFAQMINFCVGGLYFESDVALKRGYQNSDSIRQSTFSIRPSNLKFGRQMVSEINRL